MKFTKTNVSDTINDLRVKLYQKLTAPIDAMWEQLYIASSQHYVIENDNNSVIGYCCIDDKGSLIQIFLSEEFNSQMEKVITLLIDLKLISSASLSSNEPLSFNTCLYYSKSIKPNTLCFQHSNIPFENNFLLNLELVLQNDIPAIKEFLKEQVNMDDTFGYTENLVARKEILLQLRSICFLVWLISIAIYDLTRFVSVVT